MSRLVRFIRKRGVATTISGLLALASLALGFTNQWENPLITNSLYALGVLCALGAIACWYWIPPDNGPGILVEDSPDAEIRGNVPKEVADKGIEFRRSPGAKAHLNVSDEEGADEDGGNSETSGGA